MKLHNKSLENDALGQRASQLKRWAVTLQSVVPINTESLDVYP